MKSEFNYELKPGVKVRFIQNKQFKSVQMIIFTMVKCVCLL